jgi:hypothetical protein
VSRLAPITSVCAKALFGWRYLDSVGGRQRAGQRLPSRPRNWLVRILVESRATQKLHPSAVAPAHGPERNTIAGENSPNIHLTLPSCLRFPPGIGNECRHSWVDILPKHRHTRITCLLKVGNGWNCCRGRWTLILRTLIFWIATRQQIARAIQQTAKEESLRVKEG